MTEQQLTALQIRIRASTLGARIHLQERTAVRMRALGNNARLNHQDPLAECYDRAALFAERRAAKLFEELLELSEGYLKSLKGDELRKAVLFADVLPDDGVLP